MKAAYYETTGGPEVIRYGDLPKPSPKPGEVLATGTAYLLDRLERRVFCLQGTIHRPWLCGGDGDVAPSRDWEEVIGNVGNSDRVNHLVLDFSQNGTNPIDIMVVLETVTK